MRRVLFLVLTVIFISSCSQEKSKNFESIDFSRFGDLTDIGSLKIFNNGRIYIYNYNLFKEKKYYYMLTLDKSEMDTISTMTNLILNAKYDSVNNSSCTRCLKYCLIIKTKNRRFKTMYDGRLFSDRSMKNLDRLVYYMIKLSNEAEKSIDSTFVFESWSNDLLPPPPPNQDNTEFKSKSEKYLPQN